MTPQGLTRDIASDPALAARYLQEVVHMGAEVGREQLDEEMKLLGAAGADELVAWFWPDRTYASDFDPFDSDDSRNTRDPEEVRRRIYRDYVWFTHSAAKGCGVELTDMVRHLTWSFVLDWKRLEAITGEIPDLRAVADLLEALHLKFDGTWKIAHPERLAQRVKQSKAAIGIFLALQAQTRGVLPEGALEKWEKSMPRSVAVDAIETITAPKAGGRYRALFEFLAQTESPSPRFSLDELDDKLKSGGEDPLPDSAHNDRSWWAGHYTQSQGRPQIASWWAAGYRVRHVATQDIAAADPRRSEVVAVEFEKLHGQLHRSVSRSMGAGGGTADIFILAGSDPIEVIPNLLPVETPLPDIRIVDAPVVGSVSTGDGYPDIQRVVAILKEDGEADRGHLEQQLRERFGVTVTGSALTNLLTKARRLGSIDNLGSRKEPRWVATNSKGHYMLQIAKLLGFQCPRIPPKGLVPGDFLDKVQEETGIDLGAGFVAPTENVTLPDGSSVAAYSKDAKFPVFVRYGLMRDDRGGAPLGTADGVSGMATLLNDVEAAAARKAGRCLECAASGAPARNGGAHGA